METLCYEQWLIRSDSPYLSATSTITTDDIARSLGVPIPDDFLCPITLEIMKHPLRSRYGFDFERSAILEWIAKEGCCPLTRQPLRVSDLIPNRRLEDQIAQWACYNCLPSPRKYLLYDEEEENVYFTTCLFDKMDSASASSSSSSPSSPRTTTAAAASHHSRQERAQHSPLSHRLATLKSVLFHHNNNRTTEQS